MSLSVEEDSFNEFKKVGIYSTISLLAAPLRTVGIALQASVRGHKELYSPVSLKQKEGLVKASTELTVQEKRRYELMVRVS